MKKNIAVIFGGCSPEYSVSLKSAYGVLTHINTSRYQVIAVGITKDGQWLRYDGDYDKIPEDTWHYDRLSCHPAFLSPDRTTHGLAEIHDEGLRFTWLDGVFPVLHGKNGEDGSMQGLISLSGIPLIGCDTLSSALCMDKFRAHQLADIAGIRTPKSIYFDHRPAAVEILAKCKSLSYPVFVKPLRAGSSFGITKVHKEEDLLEAAYLAFSYDSQIVIEEGIDGFEVGCAVLSDRDNGLICGRVDEIELSCEFFDFHEKYTQQAAKIHMPARIDASTEKRIQAAAAKIYRALGCSGFARVDMFLTPTGEIVFNEVNTIPGLTGCSRYPQMLVGIGMDYSQVINHLISQAVEDL